MAESGAPPVPVFVALGANLGDRHAALDAAERALQALARPASSYRCSRRYESPAMRVPERPRERQPDYLNAVATLRTGLAPHALLDALQAIERTAGRQRGGGLRWAARTLDLDLLLYGEQRIDDARLTVPHPGIAERAFVLAPLHELAPRQSVPGARPIEDSGEHSGAGEHVATLLHRLPAEARLSLRLAAPRSAVP